MRKDKCGFFIETRGKSRCVVLNNHDTDLHLVLSLFNRETQSHRQTDDYTDYTHTDTRERVHTQTHTHTHRENQRTEEQELFLPTDI